MKHAITGLTLALAILTAPLSNAQETSPEARAFNCSAQCGGFVLSGNTPLLLSIPLFASGTTAEAALADLERQCTARDPKGILFAATYFDARHVQYIVPVDTYTDLDLRKWVCTDGKPTTQSSAAPSKSSRRR